MSWRPAQETWSQKQRNKKALLVYDGTEPIRTDLSHIVGNRHPDTFQPLLFLQKRGNLATGQLSIDSRQLLPLANLEISHKNLDSYLCLLR